jgi:hypothetical protein
VFVTDAPKPMRRQMRDRCQSGACRGSESGLVLTVVCRSRRPAKIAKALLCVEGHGFVKAMEEGFGASFGHTPPEGLDLETLFVRLFPLSKTQTEELHVLQRDDVCRFFLPMIIGGAIGAALVAPAQNVLLRVVFFDGEQQSVLQGELVQGSIQSLLQVYGKKQYTLKPLLDLGISFSSTTLPSVENRGC